MDRINAAFMAAPAPVVSASLVGILLFIGATGKSAQIPLHVWLPDAMAGPTPVSALIHAATMVTAGVYMVARLSGIYLHAPEACAVVAAIGAATAFFAATIAVVQTDIKKVLAYSTISQLGFMFVALGVGAYGVAIFHLYTHAFFKACLFLGAGSVIHAMGGEQDIRKMGGLARKIPVTFVTFADGHRGHRRHAAAGRLLLEGRDPLVRVREQPRRLAAAAMPWPRGTALITAFYMFRLLWLTFFGAPRMDQGSRAPRARVAAIHDRRPGRAGGRCRRSAASCPIPHFLEPLLPLPACRRQCERFETPLIVVSVAIAVAGLPARAYIFGGSARAGGAPATSLRGAAPAAVRASISSTSCTNACIGRPLLWISERVFLGLGDRKLLDGTLNGMAALGQRTAGMLGRVQTGSLHLYALAGRSSASCSRLAWSWRHG